jgi:hypothetical protein
VRCWVLWPMKGEDCDRKTLGNDLWYTKTLLSLLRKLHTIKSLDTLEAHCHHSTSPRPVSSKKGFCPGGMALSEPSQKLRSQISPRLAGIPCSVSHIAFQSHLYCLFLLYWSLTFNQHSGVVTICDHMLEWYSGFVLQSW